MNKLFWINFCAGVFFAFWILIMLVVVLLYAMNLEAELTTEAELQASVVFTGYLVALTGLFGLTAWAARQRIAGLLWPAQLGVLALIGGGLWQLYGYV